MRSEVLCILVLTLVYAYVSAQQVESSKKADTGRIFLGTSSFNFTTFTLIKYTTTTTSTFTSVTTCTTSTTVLSTCTPSGGRRRRGLFYNADNKQGSARRGLFYDEEEDEEKDGTIFLPAAPVDNKSIDLVQEITSKTISENAVVPFEVQSGVKPPTDLNNSRFLLAFGTSTYTSIVVTTSTSSLIAICSSTTGFALCGSSGK